MPDAARWAALALCAWALGGCETTAEQSARLEKQAKTQGASVAKRSARRQITRASAVIEVAGAALVHSSEGSAAVVTLRNRSASALRDVPIQIDVRDSGGRSIYTNTTPGLTASLVSVALLPGHGTLTWIDDQVRASATPASVSAEVGEGEPVRERPPPPLSVQAGQPSTESSGSEVEGTVANHSRVEQHEVVVTALARRQGRIVAAGRAVVALLAAGATSRFQIFLIGSPGGARLHFSAPATTLG